MLHIPPVTGRGSRRRVAVLCCAFALSALLLICTGSASAGAAIKQVKFRLKASSTGQPAVDVTLRFNLEKGKKADIKPSDDSMTDRSAYGASTYELLSRPVPQFQVEPLALPTPGWTVTAVEGGEVTLDYRVGFERATGSLRAPEGVEGYITLARVLGPGFNLLKGSDALMCPRDAESGSYLVDEYLLEIAAAKGEKVLVPFARDGGAFRVDGTGELLENYLCWGGMAVSSFKKSGTEVSVGFAGSYRKLSDDERGRYVDDLSTLFEWASGTLGARPGLERLAVVIDDAGRLGLEGPASSTLVSSVALFQEGATLRGDSSVAASTGLFELWNRWSMVPSPNGEAFWFQAGLPGIYGDRLAVLAGFIDVDRAYGEFARLYAAYLADPRSRSLSIEEAWKQGDMEFVIRKSTVLCAALDKRLRDLSDGSKDIDWLTGQVAKRYNHFRGRDYTLVDIEELLENATGKSWVRFFAEGVRGTGIIGASEFSSTQLFGPESGAGKKLMVRGSGKGWILLVVALAVILMIPLVFSTYVRRSVKLDLTMPKILPDDDE